MNRSKKKNGACLFLIGFLLLFIRISTASAAENILGDWEFTMDMGDMGGMGSGMNITINSTFTKGDDGATTGTWEMVFEMPEGMEGPGGGEGFGGGDFQMPTFKIIDVKIDGQNLTFTQTMEMPEGGMGGMGMGGDFSQKFTGTIKGDKIEGKLSSEMGMGPMEMGLRGTRKGTATPKGLEGDWEFITIVEDMGMEFRNNATFKKAADGTYTGTWEIIMDDMGGMGPPPGESPMFDIKIEDIKLEGDKVTFVQKFNMGGDMGMGEMIFNYTGTLKGDKIEGGFSGEMGNSVSNGTRKKAAGDDTLVGDWTFVTTFGDMGMELSADVTFKKAVDGTYSGTWIALPMEGMEGMEMGDMPTPTVTISDIKLDGEKVTFVQKVDLTEMGMGEMVSNYSGTLKGDKIEGVMSSEMGESTSIGTRKKASGAAADDALVGDWELKMSMADSGMGMGPMEFTINSTILRVILSAPPAEKFGSRNNAFNLFVRMH